MLKIQMLKNQPKPGAFPALPCYLAGQTYELATEDEVKMGKGFIKAGAAVAVGGLVKGEVILERAVVDGIRKMVETPGVTVVVQGAEPSDAEVVKKVEKAIKRGKPGKK